MLSSVSPYSAFSIDGLRSPPHRYSSTEHSAGESNNTAGVNKRGISATSSDNPGQDFSEEEKKQIDSLKATDREVRTHEQAHLSAAGGIAVSGASFSYQLGPDGIRYAAGGEVQIDTSSVSGNPAATLRKADTIRRAALAPAKPSSQDQSVAAQASAMAAKAQAEMVQEKNQQVTHPYKGETAVGVQLDVSV